VGGRRCARLADVAPYERFFYYLPPPGGITIRRVCRLVHSLVCSPVYSFVSSHPVAAMAGGRQTGRVARAWQR